MLELVDVLDCAVVAAAVAELGSDAVTAGVLSVVAAAVVVD
jgi:hypothetical protein